VSEAVFALLVVGYLLLAIYAIHAVRRYLPGGVPKVLAMATVVAFFFSPAAVASHGVAILPAWLVLLDCAGGRWRQYGSDWSDACGLTSMVVLWGVAAGIGLVFVGLKRPLARNAPRR
jgi:hypothetical protein